MAKNGKLRIGIFGIGHNHAAAAITALRAREDVEIVGLCEPDDAVREKRLRENPNAYGDIPVMSEERLLASGIRAAMVEASVPDLVPTALRCAKAGLHIHMDKPAGIDLSLYRTFLDVMREKHLVFQTGYMYRYNAGVRYVLERVRDGALGRIYNITAEMCTKHPDWFERQLIGYGVKAPVMYIFGGHLIDLCMQVKGVPGDLTAFHTESGDGDIHFEDTSLAVLTYPDGIATVRVSSCEVNGWGLREFTVYGERGTISVSPLESPMHIRETMLAEQEPWKDRYHTVEIPEVGRYDVMMHDFVYMVEGKIPYDVDFTHEYLLQKLTLEACGYTAEEMNASASITARASGD